YRKSLLQSIVAQFSFWFYKITKAFDNIDYFFALTNFQKAKVKSLGIHEQKIILKPNSLDMTFDVQNEKNGYIYVGRLEESKGVYELLKVWKSLDERFILTIIGSSDVKEDLRKEFNQKNIIFKGKCSRDMTLSYISKSKYLIQPSLLYETFGLTIIEAMSFGVPVIGFDIGTREDFIKEGENGFLCAVYDLEEVIKKSYDFAKYEELSKNAIKTAKLYENDCVIANQIDIYKNILENKV
ncbi:MAG: glycosyltransferase, partial [Campylobacterota bacterium]